MKYIRELRMGPPKSFKTGAVVGTYPKPLLYVGFDREGISVIPPKGKLPAKEELPMDVSYEDVVHIKPGEVMAYYDGAKPAPKVLAIDYTSAGITDLNFEFKPAAMSQPYKLFMDDYNQISAKIRMGVALPWKTVVFDSLTGYEDVLLNHIASYNAAALSDARQWAGQIGGKVRQTILSITTWPCHVVIICHSAIDKNENTGAIVETPSVFSRLRDDIGGLFSQFFYAVKNPGTNTPVIWPHDKMFVKGIGARWPSGLPSEVKPDFNSIYGKENLT
jgi:hypothetical protein